jgi:hypothetical protein
LKPNTSKTIAFAKPYVQYETVIFSPSGFNDLDVAATPYEGRPTPEKEALWYNLTRGKRQAEQLFANWHRKPPLSCVC